MNTQYTNNQTYHTIRLFNGGIVSMDKLAYEAYTGCGCSNHNHHWTHTLEFEGDSKGNCLNQQEIETAAMLLNSDNIEMR